MLKKLLSLILFSTLSLHLLNAEDKEQTQKENSHHIQWWRDAKVGMFIHWGLYSSLGGSWNGQTYDKEPAWIQHSAQVPRDLYEQVAIPLFKPKNDFAKEWASLAKMSGCKYIVIPAKDRDGFALFDTATTTFDAKDVTGRDLLKEILDASRNEGLKVGICYSLIDWHHPHAYTGSETGLPHILDDIKGPRSNRRYVDYMQSQIQEIINNYGPIDLFYFDGASPETQGQKWRANQILTMIREKYPHAIINTGFYENTLSDPDKKVFYVNVDNASGDFVSIETDRPIPSKAHIPTDWEANSTLNTFLAFSKNKKTGKSPQRIIQEIITSLSKGGNHLIHVGAEPDGSISFNDMVKMRTVGGYLNKNAKAVYGTKGNDIGETNITRKDNDHYLHVFNWPGDNLIPLPVTPTDGSMNARFLTDDHKQPLPVLLALNSTFISTPDPAFRDGNGTVITFQGNYHTASERAKNLGIHLKGYTFNLLPQNTAFMTGNVRIGQYEGAPTLINWNSEKDVAVWDLSLRRGGVYDVIVNCASEEGDIMTFYIGGKTLEGRTPNSPYGFTNWHIGQIEIPADDNVQFIASMKRKLTAMSPTIRSILLLPVEKSQITLRPTNARFQGEGVSLFFENAEHIGQWTHKNTTMTWLPNIPEGGTYDIFINYSCVKPNPGSIISLKFAGNEYSHTVKETGAWDRYKESYMGKFSVERETIMPVILFAARQTGDTIMRFHSVRFVKRPDNAIICESDSATINGNSFKFPTNDTAGEWTNINDSVSWQDIEVQKDGCYAVYLNYACDPKAAGSQMEIKINDRTYAYKTNATESWADYRNWKMASLDLKAGDKLSVSLGAKNKIADNIISLRSVNIIPETGEKNVYEISEALLEGKTLRGIVRGEVQLAQYPLQEGNKISWNLRSETSGMYKVILNYDNQNAIGNAVDIHVGNHYFPTNLYGTVSSVPLQDLEIGTVYFEKDKPQTMTIEVKGSQKDATAFIRSAKLVPVEHSITLTPINAKTTDLRTNFEDIPYFAGWSNIRFSAEWIIDVPQDHNYDVFIEYTCKGENAGSNISFEIGDQKIDFTTQANPTWKWQYLGKIKLSKNERTRVLAKATSKRGRYVMQLRSIRLIPTEEAIK